MSTGRNLRVRTSVGHREDTRLGVLVDEVLIGELLTVDGAATGTLYSSVSASVMNVNCQETHVAAGEVTTLKHELRDDTVEAGALVTLTLGSLAELTEVASGLGDVLLVEVEDNTARLGCREKTVSNAIITKNPPDFLTMEGQLENFPCLPLLSKQKSTYGC